METWFSPTAVAPLPPVRTALVLAPHPDDEVFGCGGCAALYAQTGATVHAHILTDGGGYLAGADRETTVALRQAESRQACLCLGLQEPTFGGMPDRSLGTQTDLAAHIRRQIERLDAQVVFCPSLWEIHPDHRATALATVAAVESMTQAGAQGPMLAFYEIGAPLRPNMLVDISSVFDLKQEAMAMFVSQLKSQRYDVHIAALNIFRSYTLALPAAAVEALIWIPAEKLGAWRQAHGDAAAPELSQVLEAALRKADGHAEESQQVLVQVQRTVDAQSSVISQLQDRAAAQAQALVDAQAKHEVLAASNAHLENQVKGLENHLAAIFASWSWRLTRPLRQLNAMRARLRGKSR